MSQAKGQSSHGSRLLSVELLRVIAMLVVAVFHTFQPWFEGTIWGDYPELVPAIGVLGFIDQMGALGNHVFMMISGCFLLPRALKDVEAGAPLVERRGQNLRRVRHILATTALYVAIAFVVGLCVPDVTSVGFETSYWLTQGLQFIWIYLFFVMLCPYIARLWSRCSRPELLLGVLVALVYGVNLYIAFVSPGTNYRELWEWRKLMSGVTYGLSFVIGGWVALRWKAQPSLVARIAPVSLGLSVAATVLAEVYAAARGDLALVDALSYKSTSPFACAMATSMLAFALSRPQTSVDDHPRLARILPWCTSGMLGFYVLQALFSMGWHQVSNALLEAALVQSLVAFVAAGVAFSAALFVVCVIIDAIVRQPLFDRAGRREH